MVTSIIESAASKIASKEANEMSAMSGVTRRVSQTEKVISASHDSLLACSIWTSFHYHKFNVMEKAAQGSQGYSRKREGREQRGGEASAPANCRELSTHYRGGGDDIDI